MECQGLWSEQVETATLSMVRRKAELVIYCRHKDSADLFPAVCVVGVTQDSAMDTVTT